MPKPAPRQSRTSTSSAEGAARHRDAAHARDEPEHLAGHVGERACSRRRRQPATAARVLTRPATSPAWVPPEPVATTIVRRCDGRRPRTVRPAPARPRAKPTAPTAVAPPRGTAYGRRPPAPSAVGVLRRRRRRAARGSLRPREHQPGARGPGQLRGSRMGSSGGWPGKSRSQSSPATRAAMAAAAQKFERRAAGRSTRTSHRCGHRGAEQELELAGPCCRRRRSRSGRRA